jgi:hypothetical protein
MTAHLGQEKKNKKKHASVGSRTRANCLEGNYPTVGPRKQVMSHLNFYRAFAYPVTDLSLVHKSGDHHFHEMIVSRLIVSMIQQTPIPFIDCALESFPVPQRSKTVDPDAFCS